MSATRALPRVPSVALLDKVRLGGPLVGALALAGASLLLYALVAISQRTRGVSPSWDLSIFTQVVSQYSQGNAPIAAIKGDGFNILGDHFSPILILVAPLYAVIPTPMTLQVVQVILMAASVFVISDVAIKRLGYVGALVGATFALSFGVVNAVNFQFHEIAFAVLFASLAVRSYLLERWVAAGAWSMALILVKEDLGLTCAALAVAIFVRSRKRSSLIVCAIGLASFAFVTFVWIPSFVSESWLYSELIPIDEFRSEPWLLAWRLVDNGVKLKTIALLVALMGVIGLRSPLALALVPTLLWRFLSENPSYYGTGLHYDAVLMPIAIGALIDASARFSHAPSRGPARWFATCSPAIAGTIVASMLPNSPIAILATVGGWVTDPREQSKSEILSLIPQGASVETDVGMMDRLVATRAVSYVGNPPGTPKDYLLVDSVAGGWSGPPGLASSVAKGRYPAETYELIFSDDGISLAKRMTGGSSVRGPRS